MGQVPAELLSNLSNTSTHTRTCAHAAHMCAACPSPGRARMSMLLFNTNTCSSAYTGVVSEVVEQMNMSLGNMGPSSAR